MKEDQPGRIRTIVWDVDDVLNDLTREWFEKEWLPAHPECRLAYRDLTANPPNAMLGVELAVYLESLDRFRLSDAAQAMRPEPALTEWFASEGQRFRHVALTARPQKTVWPAMRWVLEHFAPWFQTFGFVPSARPGEISRQPERNKGEYLAWLGKADFFIDDSPENVRAAEELGISSFLVARPWNGSMLDMPTILARLTS